MKAVLLCFGGVDEKEERWGHAVVAYGVEYKRNDLLDNVLKGWSNEYDARILIYDCNYPDEITYLYFNSGGDSFSFEKYDTADQLTGAINDIEVLDAINYKNTTTNQYAMLCFEMGARGYFLKQKSGSLWIDGTTNLRDLDMTTFCDDAITADGVGGVSGFTLVLPSLEESYTVEPENGESCQFSLTYENILLGASADAAASITFSSDGAVAASGTTGEYELSICANEGYYTLPWYMVTVSGADSEDISLKQTDDGVLITGSDLNDTQVTAENQKESKTLSFSTDAEEVLIIDSVVNGETVPTAWIDKDDDGSFESPLEKATAHGSFESPLEKATVHDCPSEKFTDVDITQYYHEAMDWTVTNGITTGTTATTFEPDAACTRAQMVTFLWRAAGSPAPASTVNPFTDVKRGEYCYDAVLWAVEKGITMGTSAATFSPDLTVTRGQTVTFLYRYAGSPTMSGKNSFTDVSSDEYYAGAVQWAVANKVTYGTSATTFSPGDNCTRAQIVTFLYRSFQIPLAE